MLEKASLELQRHLQAAAREGDPSAIIGQLVLSCTVSIAAYLAVLAGFELGGRIAVSK